MRKHVLVTALLAAVSTAAIAEGISTRFGALNIGGEFHNVLSFKGRRLIRGMNALSLVDRYRMGKTDVALLQETGGTGCPALYYFVSVSASGARATHVFGTCSELKKVTRKGRTIRVTMPGFLGPLEPQAAKEKAFRETHVFTFRDGVVTEHGRPVR